MLLENSQQFAMADLDVSEYENQRNLRVAQNEAHLQTLNLPNPPGKTPSNSAPRKERSKRQMQSSTMSTATTDATSNEAQEMAKIPNSLRGHDVSDLSKVLLEAFPETPDLATYLVDEGIDGQALIYAWENKLMSETFPRPFTIGFRLKLAAWIERSAHRSPCRKLRRKKPGTCFLCIVILT